MKSPLPRGLSILHPKEKAPGGAFPFIEVLNYLLSTLNSILRLASRPAGVELSAAGMVSP